MFLPASSPWACLTVDPAQFSSVVHTPIIIDDDDDTEVPVSPGIRAPETPLSPFLLEKNEARQGKFICIAQFVHKVIQSACL